MHQIDRLWFFGDSYCSDDSENTYIKILSDKLNANVKHLGQKGHGPISTYERFLEHKDFIEPQSDLVIFLWSGKHRKLDKHDMVLPENNVQIQDEFVNSNYIKAIENFYQYIHNINHDNIIFQACKNAAELECRKENIFNIHYFCFPQEAEVYNDKFNLSYFAMTRSDYNNFSFEEIKFFKNHFSPEGNIEFAEKIINDTKLKYGNHIN